MAEIAEIKHEVARLLTEDTVIANMNVHVYPARILPGVYERELAVFSLGSAPNQFHSLGTNRSGPAYRYGIMTIVKYLEDTFLQMDDLSLDLENAIYRILGTEYYSHTMWRKIIFPGFSGKPPSASAVQNVHIGLMDIRILP